MPFGLTNAPEEFQRRQHDIIEGLPGVYVIHDDILVIGNGATKEEAEQDHDKKIHALNVSIKLSWSTHGLVNLNSSVLPHVRSARCTRSTTSGIIKYDVPKCKTTTYQNSYTVRVIRTWNILANDIKQINYVY